MIKILKPGLLSSIQDLGRYGYQKYGVIASGVMDPLAHRLANLLVGNNELEPTMEISLLGPTIQFEEDMLISIAGADLSPTINGEAVSPWRPIFVKKGAELKFGYAKYGCRAYLAAAGGFAVPSVMESKSTYLRAEIGGYNGRALKEGDILKVTPPSVLSQKIFESLKGNQLFTEMDWTVAADLLPDLADQSRIRVIPGRQFSLFNKDSQIAIFNDPFEVTAQSDRMGYRLKGKEMALEKQEDMISEAVSFGSIQVPPDGNPIVLLADRQTTGGYPKIGQIATVDLPLIAQAKPGDSISFTEVTHEEAQRLYLEREEKIQQLKQGIKLKFR
ncbi:biotin-dependent carboxyltransferase family protein [Mesobacillus harenae]|uniref:5-oxoprolinase subunit C family protein n=1 Tax=Mesobacillus harenae TaxID=2213203 RepID=UPI00157FE07C|nr:biotin-dependent carboxyltransferase family protein [Mesobacillus harenae]